MQRVIYFLIILFYLPESYGVQQDHLFEAKKKFPYSLIGDDFGILNEDDLALNTCDRFPELFSEKKMKAFPYWKCYSINDVKFECENPKYIKEEKDFYTMLIISAKESNFLNEYISRTPIELSTCNWFKQKWNNYLKKQRHICMSGEFNLKKFEIIDGKKIKILNWIYVSFKTKLGCSSYFYDDCSLKDKLKDGCKLKEN